MTHFTDALSGIVRHVNINRASFLDSLLSHSLAGSLSQHGKVAHCLLNLG
jgi:hypothetical protein